MGARGNTTAHYPLGLCWQPLESMHHYADILQSFLEAIQWTRVPHTYGSFPSAKFEEKAAEILKVFLGVNHKSVACQLRFGLSTGKLKNSPGLTDKLGYQRVNLVEKKIYLSFLVTAAEPELATWIYFLNSEQLRALL